MGWVLILLTALHVLSGVFWAGSTFAVAHAAVTRLDRLAYAQAGAAVIAILAGGALWGVAGLTRASGLPQEILGAGAACAVVAAGLQATALPAVRQLRQADDSEALALRGWVLTSQRIGAVLLAVTVVCMVVWRYA